MKKLKLTLILAALSIMFSVGTYAQGPPKPPSDPNAGGNQDPSGPEPAGVPIEPGTGILIILAAAYGLKEFKSLRIKEGKRE